MAAYSTEDNRKRREWQRMLIIFIERVCRVHMVTGCCCRRTWSRLSPSACVCVVCDTFDCANTDAFNAKRGSAKCILHREQPQVILHCTLWHCFAYAVLWLVLRYARDSHIIHTPPPTLIRIRINLFPFAPKLIRVIFCNWHTIRIHNTNTQFY